ncbi:hypothetical protein, partial [Nostoc sp.]|uniref:hypothetical protein n=1 Tax=Nostoc sp. TaxID=1180 RepID=UPI002FF673C6
LIPKIIHTFAKSLTHSALLSHFAWLSLNSSQHDLRDFHSRDLVGAGRSALPKYSRMTGTLFFRKSLKA